MTKQPMFIPIYKCKDGYLYNVLGESDNYLFMVFKSGQTLCMCPDSRYRNPGRCKHTIMAYQRNFEIPEVDINSTRWESYAKEKEKEFLIF